MSNPKVIKSYEVFVDNRFNGPPGYGNGGYSCGVLAKPLSGAVEVTLRRPIPLDHSLTVSVLQGGQSRLHDGEDLIAEAQESELKLEVLPAPGWEESVQAAENYPGFNHHPYAACYGCGPERGEGDGLRIFSSPRADGEGWAAPWEPHTSLGNSDGKVPDEIVWTALDCPSGWVAAPILYESHPEGTRIVTGMLSVRIDQPVYTQQRYTTLGWLIGVDGRKLYTGTAIYDEEKTPVAVGTATWIIIPPKP